MLEPGSFRDRGARVFYNRGAVCRGLTGPAVQAWRVLADRPFFRRAQGDGRVIATEPLPEPRDGWPLVLRHAAVPVVSYPYEWCFGMLRDAALLHLELLADALAEDVTLKDATPYNVQWQGARPVFIDVPSFVPLAPGAPWAGYRQFCQLFLYPLLLQAYRRVPFQPWLRGRLDGITPAECARLLGWAGLVRAGVFRHVHLQAWLQGLAAPAGRDLRADLQAAGFQKELILANVRGLRRLVERLCYRPEASPWDTYDRQPPYAAEAQAEKEVFVRRVLTGRRWGQVWDLGCHQGKFARVAAEHAAYVVALDRDAAAVERLYQGLKAEGCGNLLPLVADLADAAPDQGWRGRERKALPARGRPDLALCLALLHHLVLDANLPLPEVIAWLADLAPELVIEFVRRDDPMVQGLLRHKDEPYPDYDEAAFEACLGRSFRLAARLELPGGTRVLYHAVAGG